MPKREKSTKRVKYRRRIIKDSRRRTSRAIFDVDNENESPVRTVGCLMSRRAQLLDTTVSDTGISSQNRKRGAATFDKAETFCRSLSSQNQQMVKKKKPSTRAFTDIPTMKDSKKLDLPSVKNGVVQDTVLPDEAVSSQNVLNCGRILKPVSHIQNAGTASRRLRLPTVQSSKHPDLNVITPKTVAKVIQGKYENHLAQTFQLLDCRFPYEFQGGSLTGARSLCDPKKMEMQLFSTATTTTFDDSRRPVLIFFCEFSATRGPKMLRHVRNVDRSLHVDSYPELYYPELYLIEGGYKHCFETLRHELCAPLALYVAMGDKRFTEMCRHEFAVWKRSWKLHRTVAKCVEKVKMSEKVSSCCDQARLTLSGVRSLFQEL